MKNVYEKPLIEIVVFSREDIVTASAYAIEEDAAKGNAYESVQSFK
ncbi:MAG: hypothetical protein ACI396_02065 [Acutalibacteraceae bacterium]